MEGENDERFKRRKVWGPYKTYLRPFSEESQDNSALVTRIPRTTAWRLKQRAAQNESGLCNKSEEQNVEDSDASDLADQSENNYDVMHEEHNLINQVDFCASSSALSERIQSPNLLVQAEECLTGTDGSDDDLNISRIEYSSTEDEVSDSDCSEDISPDQFPVTESDQTPCMENVSSFSNLRKNLEKDLCVCIGKAKSDGTPGKGLDVIVTAGELLQMALKVATKNSLSNQALLDVINMLNSMFVTDVLPSNQYGLDKVLFDKESYRYHFFCKNCFNSLEQTDKNVAEVICEICSEKNPVSGVASNNHFVMIDLKHQLQVLLSDTGVNLITPQELLERYNGSEMTYRDIYDGEMYKDHFFSRVVETSDDLLHLSLTFSVDGLPLFKPSNTSVWPITAIVNELPPKERFSKVVLLGLWYGSTKAKLDLLLEPFAKSLTEAGQNVIEISYRGVKRRTKIHVLTCCVDSGARRSVQGVSQHNGTCGCNWCYQNGVTHNGAKKYPILETESAPKRSVEKHVADCERLRAAWLSGEKTDINLLLQTGGVRAISPLLKIPSFNIVSGMIVEYMHCSLLGCTRFFLLKWLESAIF